MIRTATAAVLLTLTFNASADCTNVDGKFENMSVGTVLALLAEEAGFNLRNPEVATRQVSMVFEQEDSVTVLAEFAWTEGFELRFKGSDVWLVQASPGAAGI